MPSTQASPRDFAGCRAAGICQRRGRRADHDLFRRRKSDFHDPGSRPLAEGARPRLLQETPRREIPQGIMRTVVPAAPDAWITALERFGTMNFGEVAQSAISYARDGFPVYPLMSEIIADHEAEYRAFPSNVALYLPKGRPPQPGEVFVQKALGATLQHMVDQEAAVRSRGREIGLAAARDAFYRGDIARAIVKYQKETAASCRPRISAIIVRASTSRRDLVRRHQALCLRPLVPGAVVAAGVQPSGWRRVAQAGPQLRWLPAPHHRGGEALLCGPRGLFRRPAHRRRADRGAAVARLCAQAARDDPPG